MAFGVGTVINPVAEKGTEAQRASAVWLGIIQLQRWEAWDLDWGGQRHIFSHFSLPSLKEGSRKKGDRMVDSWKCFLASVF